MLRVPAKISTQIAAPTKYIPTYYATYPQAFVDTDPGVASTPAVVRLPSINLRVTQGGAAPTLKFATAKILVTSKSLDCGEVWRYSGPLTIDANGWMLTPALPFGDYEICASLQRTGGLEYRRTTTTTNVLNRLPEGIKPPGNPVIDVSNATLGLSLQCF